MKQLKVDRGFRSLISDLPPKSPKWGTSSHTFPSSKFPQNGGARGQKPTQTKQPTSIAR